MYRPTKLQPLPDSARRVPKLLSPLAKILSFTKIGDFPRCPFIKALLFHRNPSAVLFTVGAFIIAPLEGEACRTLTHISKKEFITKPSFTEGDAPPSIIREGKTVGVQAPLFHSAPNPVGSSITVPEAFEWVFSTNTSAALYLFDAAAPLNARVPTFTEIMPSCITSDGLGFTRNSDISKRHAS